MIPQGTAPINIDFFKGIQDRINGCSSCDQLNGVVGEAYASVEANIDAINAQLALIQPILALLNPPSANLTQIVTWITNYITAVLTPMVAPYAIYPVALAEIAAQMAELPDIILNKSLQFPSCSVPIPPLPGLP